MSRTPRGTATGYPGPSRFDPGPGREEINKGREGQQKPGNRQGGGWRKEKVEEDCGCDHIIEEAEYQGKKVKLNDPFRTPDEKKNETKKVCTAVRECEAFLAKTVQGIYSLHVSGCTKVLVFKIKKSV